MEEFSEAVRGEDEKYARRISAGQESRIEKLSGEMLKFRFMSIVQAWQSLCEVPSS